MLEKGGPEESGAPVTEVGKAGGEEEGLDGWGKQFSSVPVALEQLNRHWRRVRGETRVGVNCIDYLLLGNKLLET